jgi:gluconolactonase
MGKTFKEIVPEDMQFEKLATGFQFIEGPIWIQTEGCLVFSDIYGDQMHRWSPESGLTSFRNPSSKANGNALDAQGRIITCEHIDRRVSRTEADGSLTCLASHYEGKKLNSPNDVIVKSDGTIYFSDPPSGIQSDKAGQIRPQELPFCGLFKVNPDGTGLSLLADDFTKPNGLAFSPDESLLYINDTTEKLIRVFDVDEDGRLSGGRLFATLKGDKPGVPDGMKVDSEGNVYCSGPGPGIWIFDPAGEHLGTILPPEKAANFAWGDSDWKSFYLCASSSLYRIRLNVAGVSIP